MTTLKGPALDDRIHAFMDRKSQKYPDLQKQSFTPEEFTIAEIFSTRYLSFGKRIGTQF